MTSLSLNTKVNLRKLYGPNLIEIKKSDESIVVLDAETSNSTGCASFKDMYPDSFIECYIAEQNMVSMATSMGTVGFTPFISTFGAFLSRAYDQIRMSQYAQTTLNIIGTHCGVSIGEDGPSQMALDDIAFFGALFDTNILYPCDEISFKACLSLMQNTKECTNYCRVTRGDMYSIYTQLPENSYSFELGGSNVVYRTKEVCEIAIIAAGVTLGESIKAVQTLENEGFEKGIKVIDLYGIKPLNIEQLKQNMSDSSHLIIVEDHAAHGGLYGTVCEGLASDIGNIQSIQSLSVTKIPRSGKPHELLAFEEIDAQAIIKKINSL